MPTAKTYVVLTFLDNQLAQLEAELNNYTAYDIVHVWSSNTKISFILRKKDQRGRPAKTETEE